jgi:3-oxoacyl-[acyl-carrier protein] reductase
VNVLVTGASRGIGRAIALAFGRAGHQVMVNYSHSQNLAENVVKEIHAAGGKATAFQADVSSRDQARRLVEAAVAQGTMSQGPSARGPGLDVVINNAGIVRDRTLLKMTEEEWRQVIDVNLSGAFWVLQAAAQAFVAAKDGCILNVTSSLAFLGGFGSANYAASKAGLIALTKSAAQELGRFNVRVNAFLPGYQLTDMNSAVTDEQREKIRAQHVLGRFPDREELARFVVHLASLKSVSGQIFHFESRIF